MEEGTAGRADSQAKRDKTWSADGGDWRKGRLTSYEGKDKMISRWRRLEKGQTHRLRKDGRIVSRWNERLLNLLST